MFHLYYAKWISFQIRMYSCLCFFYNACRASLSRWRRRRRNCNSNKYSNNNKNNNKNLNRCHTMPETLPATATVSASSVDCTVAVLKVPSPTMQMPQACNLQSLGLIMEPNNINIELNPAATTSDFKVSEMNWWRLIIKHILKFFNNKILL